MSKPAPVVLCESIKKDYLVQIIKADRLWVVTLKGQLFNLKHTSPPNSPFTTHKYMKSSFSNPGFAYVLAKRLNEQFKCNDFEVKEITNV